MSSSKKTAIYFGVVDGCNTGLKNNVYFTNGIGNKDTVKKLKKQKWVKSCHWEGDTRLTVRGGGFQEVVFYLS